jgi:hypothetical protein
VQHLGDAAHADAADADEMHGPDIARHLHGLFRRQRRLRRHRLGEELRALAAAEHQQPERLFATATAVGVAASSTAGRTGLPVTTVLRPSAPALPAGSRRQWP